MSGALVDGFSVVPFVAETIGCHKAPWKEVVHLGLVNAADVATSAVWHSEVADVRGVKKI